MAVEFSKSLAPSAERINIYTLDPREIRINPELNGRHEEPSIDDLVDDFLNPKIGQIQPVLITKDDDGAPMLRAGHRRWRAAIEVTRRKLGPFDGVFRLKCQYFKGTELDCFILTVKENLGRVQTMPIDDGYNISRLHNNFGMSYEDIAIKVYNRRLADGSPDVKWIEDTESLAELAAEAAEAVVGGKVKPSAVRELAKLSKTAQRALLKSTEGKITAAVVKRAAAPPPPEPAAEPASDSPTGGKPAKNRPRSVSACIELVQQYINMDLPSYVCTLPCAEAVHKILGELYDEMSGN